MSTPLISPIKNVGGTFYTFPSASEDFNFSQTSSNKKFSFSKFALLDIPDVRDTSTGINSLGIEHIPSSYLNTDTSDWNQALAESLQNYCFNLESHMVTRPDYDINKNSTISERVFWKWMKEMGAIRWREANVGNPESGGERTRRTEDSILVNDLEKRQEIGKRFVEEDQRTTFVDDFYPYDRVVKYLGSIDIVNGVRYQSSSFLELYTMVPTDVGSTPTVLFKSVINDSNYTHGTVVTHNPKDRLDSESILGRSFNDSHPAGLDIRALYDSDNSGFSRGSQGVDSYLLHIKRNGEDTYESGWWFPDPEANSYFTEPERLNDFRNDWMKIEGFKNSVSSDREFLRSRLDGVEVDFDLARSYSDNLSGEYRSFEDYNRSDQAEDFSFNAILVYYDLEDLDDPSRNATNLFGVLFLDKLQDSLSSIATIPGLKKYKPDTLSRQNGNSYAWKINLKFDLNANDGVEITSVNEYNNFSMHLFLDALQTLKNSSEKVQNVLGDLFLLKSKIDDIEDLVINTDNIQDLNSRIDSLQESIESSASLLSDSKSIIDLIDRNYAEITNIYKNKTSVEMSYNTDVIRAGRGIVVDKTNYGVVTIGTDKSSYNIGKSLIGFDDLKINTKGNYLYHNHILKTGTNYLKIGLVDSVISMDDSQRIVIFINDSETKWVSGQSLRLVFGSEFVFTDNLERAITIYTDSGNIINSTDGEYSAIIDSLSQKSIKESEGSPIIDILCIDPDSMMFTTDKIR